LKPGHSWTAYQVLRRQETLAYCLYYMWLLCRCCLIPFLISFSVVIVFVKFDPLFILSDRFIISDDYIFTFVFVWLIYFLRYFLLLCNFLVLFQILCLGTVTTMVGAWALVADVRIILHLASKINVKCHRVITYFQKLSVIQSTVLLPTASILTICISTSFWVTVFGICLIIQGRRHMPVYLCLALLLLSSFIQCYVYIVFYSLSRVSEESRCTARLLRLKAFSVQTQQSLWATTKRLWGIVNYKRTFAMRPFTLRCGNYFRFRKGILLEYCDMLLRRLADALVLLHI